MIIRNFVELATSKKRHRCLEILESGLAAANPAVIIPKFVTKSHIKVGTQTIILSEYARIYTVAVGKAGDSMTGAVDAAVGVDGGLVVIPKGSKSTVSGKRFRVFNSGHPIPDRNSVKAARELVKFLQSRHTDDLVIFLVSGGASSLLALPDRITLGDKTYMTNLLLKSGVTIGEFNCIRKHLSKIKGGRLVSDLRCAAVGLVMSDVEHDDISAIASGITSRDDTTFQDALDVLNKYNLRSKTPPEILRVLEDGSAGRIPETPKSDMISNYIIAGNHTCTTAMREKAEQLGYSVDVVNVFGDIRDAARKVVSCIPKDNKSCLIFGGETTVRVTGDGTGGRNHEMVLRLLKNTQDLGKLTIASIDTDGIDGNTAFAGAITENLPIDTAQIREFIRNSDSGGYFQMRNANIKTGPTHTNLMDIGVVLR